MKKIMILAAFGIFAGVVSGASSPTGKEWEDQTLTGGGKEAPKAWFSSFPDVKSSMRILPKYNPNHICLDSETEWRFNWCSKPSDRPVDFYKPGFDVSSWEVVRVPCSWQAIGIRKSEKRFGIPIYSNQNFIFTPFFPANTGCWPRVTGHKLPEKFTMKSDENPVGSYRRDFEIPADWNGSRIHLQFDGVDSFYYVWVNGKYMGFAKDSRIASVFDVTDAVRPGKNMVAVEVYRNNDGSYLEAQDMFRLSGIFRSVSVYRLPSVRIRDAYFTTSPVEKGDYKGDWRVPLTVKVKNDSASAAERTIAVQAFGADGRKISLSGKTELAAKIAAGKEVELKTELVVDSPELWSAELPNLYTLVLTTENGGKVCEAVPFLLGFREIEIRRGKSAKDNVFLVNGKPVKLKGVNRHECDPYLGHTVTDARQLEDFKLLKQGNINHIRNAHYPQNPYFYYLANKLGIYVMDEANIESHGFYYGKASPSRFKEWEAAHVARVLGMVEWHKNHPSIVIWSLGNEAGPGDNFKTCYNEAKKVDSSRPFQYERNNDIVDMGSNQYPSVGSVKDTASGKASWVKYPFYISEYAHNMNNAMGNLKDYQDAIESSDRILGAAIWDWVDQGLYLDTTNGARVIGYGGDFGDYPNDGQFVFNGVILADRTPEPGYYEVKHVFQNFSVAAGKNASKLLIRNKNYFRDNSYVSASWKLLHNGVIVDSGKLKLPKIEPQGEREVDVPKAALEKITADGEWDLRVEFALCKTESCVLPAGFVIAADQIGLAAAKPAKYKVCENVSSSLTISEADGKVIVCAAGSRIRAVFDRASGALVNYAIDGRELLKAPVGVNLFRCPSSNELTPAEHWFKHGLRCIRQTAEKFELAKTDNGSLQIKVSSLARGVNRERARGYGRAGATLVKLGPTDGGNAHFKVNMQWTVNPDGSIACQSVFIPRGMRIQPPRIGFELQLDSALSKVTYFGNGPFENYPDRVSGAFAGVWSADVRDMIEGYGRPQEMGNRGGVRWVRVEDAKGMFGFTVLGAEAPFSFAALPYTPTDLFNCSHPAELPPSDKTVLTLSCAVRGLGGDSCGPPPLERDILRMNRVYDFSFVIRPELRSGDKSDCQGLVSLPDANLDRALNDNQDNLTVIECSSMEPSDGAADYVCDNNPDTFWHTRWRVTQGKYPHSLTFDAKRERNLKGLWCLGRGDGTRNGRVKNYSVETSLDGKTWTQVASGILKNTAEQQDIRFGKTVRARYIRFRAESEHFGQDYASMAEIGLIE